MSWIDWSIVAIYAFFAIGIGLYFRRRSQGSVENFFLSGRSMPWWVLAISMVATTYAADTPLAVSGIIRDHGLSGNWVWWNMAIGWVISVYFYAGLWRRAGIVTDAELIDIRYSGSNAPKLRSFYAIYNGLIINVIVCSWVINAMTNIVQVVTNVDESSLVIMGLLVIAAVYALLSGFYGVVISDVVQFILAMAGAVLLAYYAVNQAGGLAALSSNMDVMKRIDFFPDFSVKSVLVTFIAYLGVQWWAQRESSMPGYFAQRMFAARTPRDAQKAALLFNFLHYAIRPWPWILTAFAAIFLFSQQNLDTMLAHIPNSQRGEASYALLIAHVLPEGVKGFVFMSLAAAFMSTIDTQANWGASYLVQDIVLPWRQRQAAKSYIASLSIATISRLAMLLIIILSAGVSQLLDSVTQAWKFIFAFTAGLGPVYLLRWYWHRVNAEAEIGAMVSGALITIAFTIYSPFPDEYDFAGKLFASVVGSAIIWLAICFWGPRTDLGVLRNFYRRIHLHDNDNGVIIEEGWGLQALNKNIYWHTWLKVSALLSSIFIMLWAIREILFFNAWLGWVGVASSITLLAWSFAEKSSNSNSKQNNSA